MSVLTPIYRSSPKSPTGEQISYDNGKTWQTYWKPIGKPIMKPSKPKPKPIPTPQPSTPTTTQPKTTPTTPVAQYKKELRGVVTSTGQFYPTTNKRFIPQGFQQGEIFLDIRETPKGTTYIPIRKQETQYAKSTREGITITRIQKQTTQPTFKPVQEKSYSNEYINLGGGLVIKRPTEKPTKSLWSDFKKSSKHVINIFTLGNVGKEIYNIGKSTFTSTFKTITYIGTQTNIPFTRSSKLIRETQIFKAEKPTTEDILITASLPIGAYSKAGLTGLGIIGGYLTYKEVKQEPSLLITNPERILVHGGLSALAIKQGAYNKIFDIIATRGLKEIKYPSKKVRPFERKGEVFYFERVQKVSIKSPQTWITKLKGYKPGQFLEKRERIIAPEVYEYYFGSGKGTKFPFDNPKTFEKWFKKGNIRLFRLPKVSRELKQRPFGYSATSSGGKIRQIGEAGQFYSGKGVSVAFLRISTRGNLPLGQDFLTGNKPFIYALYGKGTKVVPKAFEIKAPNPYEPGGKPIKKYVFPNINRKGGIFYIPTNKPEVQAVVYGEIIPIRKEYYIKLGDRRVPIQEFITGEDILAKQKYKGIKSQKQRSSILPSKYKPSLKITYYKLSSSKRPISSSYISSRSYSSITSLPSSYSSSSSISKSKLSYSTKSKSSITRISTTKLYSGSSSITPSRKFNIKVTIKDYLYKSKGKPGILKRIFGYRTFYTKKGKQVYLPGVREKGSAVRYGEIYATKTLRATFGVKRTSYLISSKEQAYTPSAKYFRSYKIRKGKPIRLYDTFIQRRGKRLAFGGEVAEIQKARRMAII